MLNISTTVRGEPHIYDEELTELEEKIRRTFDIDPAITYAELVYQFEPNDARSEQHRVTVRVPNKDIFVEAKGAIIQEAGAEAADKLRRQLSKEKTKRTHKRA